MTHTSTMTPTQRLSDAGVSIWLDDLSRERIQSGSLKELIKTRNVVGVTTNPTIFAAALAHGESYAEQIKDLAGTGTSAADAVFEITTTDVALASDILRPIFVQTQGFDGRVSIECAPVNAHRADATIAEAKALWSRIDRHNVMIKIPATAAGLEAITAVIGAGISVNVTLIFSLDRYREVIAAYLAGLERAKRAGLDLSSIHSVASFFVSRLDTEIDRRLDAIGTDEAHALRGQAGIANARLAYEVYQESFTDQRAQGLIAAGANEQRPLWASTGVKDPTRPDTMYVVELAASDVVNTMPERTLEATHDHASVRGDTITGSYPAAVKILDRIAAIGISYAGVTDYLEAEGLNKFRASWNDLLQTVRLALEAAK
ncbi:transaldolase [Cryobacterium sandaracinum]|uniref:Transaldolase n=1 Tax=Cryobacterium sandaracinum TaxID=1259247 RepID=A0ABY2J896_9MICO|nr:transaldolase [Cryobacterium sandaracinum]TFC99916.1 transaldolase [Cryobacterium sandaracinum]